MRISIITVFFVATSLSSLAQDTLGYNWVSVGELEIDSSSYWTLDGLNNNLTVSNNVISKIDSLGVVKFTQSIKSLGNESEIFPINAMKIMHFSEAQQTLCFFDNTLTQVDDCIDLVDLDIINATLIATSSRPDMIWIFDNVNSSLALTSMVGDFVKQETININGILAIDSVIQMIESNGRLYLLDARKGVYVFDLLGSLIEYIEMPNVRSIDVSNESIFAIRDSELLVRTMGENEIVSIAPPTKEIKELKFRNGIFYFRTEKNVHKYQLQF